MVLFWVVLFWGKALVLEMEELVSEWELVSETVLVRAVVKAAWWSGGAK